MLSRVVFIILHWTLLVLADSRTTSALDITIYSNNVRYAASRRGRGRDELPWKIRKHGVVDAIKSQSGVDPILIGLQEVTHAQLKDILKGLNKKNSEDDRRWTFFGVGRDNGHKKGEYSPILYNTAEWNLLNGTYKWLSFTPDKPSKYPRASKKRIVTMGTFSHVKTGKVVNFVNTHLDHRSVKSREYSAKLIIQYIKSIPNYFPTFLCGDFNSLDTDKAYATFSHYMVDASYVAEKKYDTNLKTFSGFGNGTSYSIDFIWSLMDTNDNSGTNALSYTVLDNLFDEGHRFSDHRPVMARYSVTS